LLPQDIKIPVIGANFVKDILWPVPLIEHLLNYVLASIEPETNRPLVRLQICSPHYCFFFQGIQPDLSVSKTTQVPFASSQALRREKA
jgi:hypothetical protein